MAYHLPRFYHPVYWFHIPPLLPPLSHYLLRPRGRSPMNYIRLFLCDEFPFSRYRTVAGGTLLERLTYSRWAWILCTRGDAAGGTLSRSFDGMGKGFRLNFCLKSWTKSWQVAVDANRMATKVVMIWGYSSSGLLPPWFPCLPTSLLRDTSANRCRCTVVNPKHFPSCEMMPTSTSRLDLFVWANGSISKFQGLCELGK